MGTSPTIIGNGNKFFGSGGVLGNNGLLGGGLHFPSYDFDQGHGCCGHSGESSFSPCHKGSCGDGDGDSDDKGSCGGGGGSCGGGKGSGGGIGNIIQMLLEAVLGGGLGENF